MSKCDTQTKMQNTGPDAPVNIIIADADVDW
jgi:hypothetical protein